MKEINIRKAPQITSPNPLTLICTEKPDGCVNLAPVSFVSYLAFNPPIMGFAMGQKSYTGQRVRETGKAVITVPGTALAEAAMSCGSCSGRDTDKAGKFGIELASLPDSSIRIPADTALALTVSLKETVEVGDHYLYICNVDKVYSDDTKEPLFAWNGYSCLAPAQKKA